MNTPTPPETSTPLPSNGDDPVPAPGVIRKKNRISWIWLVPLVAAIAGASLVVRTWMQTGPRITISFSTAEGLEVGKTQVRYKDVTVGIVNNIQLSHDWDEVIVTADISKHAEALASEGTRFWVVRPRLGLSGVSGLNTLLSGAYIGVDAPGATAHEDRTPQHHFTGLENPPEVTHNLSGSRYTLKANSLGSLDIGSPVYYRRINVGRVIGYGLDPTGTTVNIQVFINAPHDRFVTRSARFWNASGIDLHLGTDGFKLHTQSMASLILGGIAFESLHANDLPAAAEAAFTLHENETEARALPDGEVWPIRMHFHQSIRGLAVGAPIDFKGVTLGEVTSIIMDFDSDEKQFFAVVDANVYPQRLGSVYDRIAAMIGTDDTEMALLAPMIERGLRAQLHSSNLLTGQLYIVLNAIPDAEPVTVIPIEPILIPTVPGELDQLQQQLSNIVAKVEKLPLEQIGNDVRTLLADTSRLMRQIEKQVAPEARATLRQATKSLADLGSLLASDAPLPLNADRAMQELSRAARSLRALADFLQANPDALVRGRAADGTFQQR